MGLDNKCENHFVINKIRWNVNGESRSHLDKEKAIGRCGVCAKTSSFPVLLFLGRHPFSIPCSLLCLALDFSSRMTEASQPVSVSWELGPCGRQTPRPEGHCRRQCPRESTSPENLPHPGFCPFSGLTFHFPFQSVLVLIAQLCYWLVACLGLCSILFFEQEYWVGCHRFSSRFSRPKDRTQGLPHCRFLPSEHCREASKRCDGLHQRRLQSEGSHGIFLDQGLNL